MPHMRPRHITDPGRPRPTQDHVMSQTWTLPVPFLTRALRSSSRPRITEQGGGYAQGGQAALNGVQQQLPGCLQPGLHPRGAAGAPHPPGSGEQAAGWLRERPLSVPSPCTPRLGAWAHGQKGRLLSAQKAGRPGPRAGSPRDPPRFALCPRAHPGTVCSVPMAVPGRAGQEGLEGQLGTEGEVKARFRALTAQARRGKPAAARGPPGGRRCCLSTWAFMLCLEAKSRSQLDTGHLLFGAATSCRCFLAWM